MQSNGIMVTAVALVVALALIMAATRFDYLAWDRGKIGLPTLHQQTEIQTHELPELVEAMSQGTAKVRYAALIFTTPDRPADEDSLNLQVSMEDGKAGVYWVLLGGRNIEDEERFRTFALEKGLEPFVRTQNGVSYLRIEDLDVPGFTESVVTEMYNLPADEPVGLVFEGFEWR